jgi:hypothetical protein
MLDTLSLARELKDAGIEPNQADAITHVVQQAAEHGDPATRTDLDAHGAAVRADFDTHRTAVRGDLDAHRTAVRGDLDTLRAEVRADITALEARLIKWMIGVALTATGIVVATGTALVLAVLRTLG